MPGQVTELLHQYRKWLDGIDNAFEHARLNQPGAIPCHGGCSQCCYTLFAVPAIDGFLLWQGLLQQGQASAESALNRCRQLFLEFKESVCLDATIPFRVEHYGWDEFDKMVDVFQQPCPFLTDSGWCGVYKWRPRICRLAGTVFKDMGTGYVLQDFCPLAEDARQKTGFQWAPFDIAGMDGRLMEFRQEFQVALRTEKGIELPSGMTFPVAGVLEAALVCNSSNKTI